MKQALIEKCDSYLFAQAGHDKTGEIRQHPAVTISRETGTGAVELGEALAEYLQKYLHNAECPWAVFERNIVQRVMEEHRLPSSMEPYLEENTRSLVDDTVENLLGLHPAASALVQHTAETIFNLARRGNCIIIGRGSHIITAPLKNVLHVRLVAPLEQRIQRIERFNNLSRKDAEALVAKTDRARSKYVRQNFNSKLDDPLAYDVTINMGRVTIDGAATVIGQAVILLAARLPILTGGRTPALR